MDNLATRLNVTKKLTDSEYQLLLVAGTIRVIYLLVATLTGGVLYDSSSVSIGLAYGGDIFWYFQMAARFASNIPYAHIWFDYPPISAYLFTLIYALASGDLQCFTTMLRLLQLPLELMTTLVIYRLAKHFSGASGYSFLAALSYNLSPVTLFTWMSRFDCIPTFFAVLSVYMLLKKRLVTSFLVLAAGTMFKWFPAIFLPLWLAYSTGKMRLVGFLTFASFCVVIMMPFFLLTPQKFVEAVLLYHAFRGPNDLSNLASINFFLYHTPYAPGVSKVISILSLASQAFFCLAPPLFFSRSEDGICAGCAFAILGVIAFAGFFSPQWLIWANPFLLVNTWQKRRIWLVYWVLQGVIYLQYPVIWQFHHIHLKWPRHWWRPYVFYGLTAIRSLALLIGAVLIAVSLRSSIFTSLKRIQSGLSFRE